MLVEFFLKLRGAAIPVSITEYLALLDALDRDVGGSMNDHVRRCEELFKASEQSFDPAAVVDADTFGRGLLR